MFRYIVKFSKQGYIKYTSHLDMLRLFKRAIKKSNINLQYSQGFNPHPKLGFGQPLSLGYMSNCEILEMETREEYSTDFIKTRLTEAMPEGIEIIYCTKLKDDFTKSIASVVNEAEYFIKFPVKKDSMDFESIVKDYLKQDSINALKRQKKTKKLVNVDIKNKIRSISVEDDEYLSLIMRLDCGSQSNLSPEQVISSFIEFSEMPCERYEIEVTRAQLFFDNNLQF